MSDVSRRQGRPAGGNDSSYLDVADFDPATGALPTGGDDSRGQSGGLVEGLKATLEVFCEELIERQFQLPPAPACWQ
jgi:hypothetical protein